jgi:hypothetical protein
MCAGMLYGERERKTGKEGERVRERCRICPELFIFKRNDRCLGPF